MRHEYHPEAFAELIAVAEWYEAELHSLGMSFQDEIERVLALLRNAPPRCCPALAWSRDSGHCPPSSDPAVLNGEGNYIAFSVGGGYGHRGGETNDVTI